MENGDTIVLSRDGSYTAYSRMFNEHYHSTKDGALHESLGKHVIPAFEAQKGKAELTILDICFGLGFNTLATLYYADQNRLPTRLRIFSPELDGELVRSLASFPYPEIFEPYKAVIASLSREGYYRDERLEIRLFIGDAREYLGSCGERFDIVYQDAFSPAVNPILWTREYFADVSGVMKDDAVLTTYSTALKTRLALHENGMNLFLNRGEGYRDATVASRRAALGSMERVDMGHKIACNPGVAPASDRELGL